MPQRTLAAATLAGQIMSMGTDFTAATAFHFAGTNLYLELRLLLRIPIARQFAGAVGAWVQLTLRRVFSWTTAIRG